MILLRAAIGRHNAPSPQSSPRRGEEIIRIPLFGDEGVIKISLSLEGEGQGEGEFEAYPAARSVK